jgi:hypothetical protein
LRRALAFLQQAQPPAAPDTVPALLDHALAHWSPAAVPCAAAVIAPD